MSRKSKWQSAYPPPPSPKILHFALTHRSRRKPAKPITPLKLNHHTTNKCLPYGKKLEKWFSESTPLDEIIYAAETPERVASSEVEEATGFEEEKWKFQAEVLRAECNLLRMERQFALKKLEKNRVKMERTLRSAVQTLMNGRKKIFEGENASTVLEEEIEELEEKLHQFQTTSRNNNNICFDKCSNFDKKASILQQKLGGGFCVESTTSLSVRTDAKSIDNVEEKMNEFSNRLVDTFDEVEYKSIVSSFTNSSADCSIFSSRQPLFQEAVIPENKCTGRCKELVRKIVEQVRGETEQWSQMQDMVAKVRGEMEQLQLSRDYWENRAHESNQQVRFLRLVVNQWRDKALSLENKVKKLRFRLEVLFKLKLQDHETIEFPQDSLLKLIQREKNMKHDDISMERNEEILRILTEKRTLPSYVNETRKSIRVLALRRSPLKEIENSSPRHNSL